MHTHVDADHNFFLQVCASLCLSVPLSASLCLSVPLCASLCLSVSMPTATLFCRLRVVSDGHYTRLPSLQRCTHSLEPTHFGTRHNARRAHRTPRRAFRYATFTDCTSIVLCLYKCSIVSVQV